MGTTAADRIERFLAANPSGPVVIAVGYASAFGLSWLQERTARRPVSVLIGDTRAVYWQKMTSDDRAEAKRFLDRRDVEVHNWYRTDQSRDDRSEAHLKAWLVHNRTRVTAALVGSANLTHNGLYKNVEIMVEPAARDLPTIWSEAHALWGKSWDARDRLIRYLDGDFTSAPADRATGRRQQSERPSTEVASPAPRRSAPRRGPASQRSGSSKGSKSFSASKPSRRRRFN